MVSQKERTVPVRSLRRKLALHSQLVRSAVAHVCTVLISSRKTQNALHVVYCLELPLEEYHLGVLDWLTRYPFLDKPE